MLESLQRHFFEALRNERPAPQLGASNISREQTWSIYRRNYMDGHVAALADTYSTVRELVGNDYFAQLARIYVARAESLSGDLNDYGGDFANFLAVFLTTAPGGASLPYLPDIARLDWLWFTQLRAQSSPGGWLDRLLALPLASWQDVKVISSAHLLRSKFPIFRIWELAHGAAAEVNLNTGGEAVLISRQGQVTVTMLNQAQAVFIEQWFSGNTLGQAVAAAVETDDEFGLFTILTMLAAHEAVLTIEEHMA